MAAAADEEAKSNLYLESVTNDGSEFTRIIQCLVSFCFVHSFYSY